MGLRDRVRGDDHPETQRFQMREKLMSFGDDFWIEDDNGRRAYKVDGKAVRVRDTFVLRDAGGQEVAKIQERKLRVRDTMDIERAGGNATVKKAVVGLRDRFKIEVHGGSDLSAHGNLVDHEYEIEADGTTVATVEAPIDGLVLYIVATPPITKGQPIGCIGTPAGWVKTAQE